MEDGQALDTPIPNVTAHLVQQCLRNCETETDGSGQERVGARAISSSGRGLVMPIALLVFSVISLLWDRRSKKLPVAT